MFSELANLANRVNSRLKIVTPDISEHAFIIGAMKSGTTTLYEYLIQHPQIAPNRFMKEPEFFSRREPPLDLRLYKRQYFPLSANARIALDGSTGYTKMPIFPNVADRIKLLKGKKHFIYIVRDPLKRIESHIAHRIAFQGLRLREGERPDFGRYLSYSKYSAQLSVYERAFPKTPVKVITLDDLVNDVNGTLRGIARHLGISDGHKWRVLPPKNTRASINGADKFRLIDQEKTLLQKLLRSDMSMLSEKYDVDVKQWGFA